MADVETKNIKQTISDHGNKIDSQNEKVATLRADLQRLLRLEVEYDRLKDELTRLQSHSHKG
jgi:predicted  nucleic acid-binding Zn-ribbon protein